MTAIHSNPLSYKSPWPESPIIEQAKSQTVTDLVDMAYSDIRTRHNRSAVRAHAAEHHDADEHQHIRSSPLLPERIISHLDGRRKPQREHIRNDTSVHDMLSRMILSFVIILAVSVAFTICWHLHTSLQPSGSGLALAVGLPGVILKFFSAGSFAHKITNSTSIPRFLCTIPMMPTLLECPEPIQSDMSGNSFDNEIIPFPYSLDSHAIMYNASDLVIGFQTSMMSLRRTNPRSKVAIDAVVDDAVLLQVALLAYDGEASLFASYVNMSAHHQISELLKLPHAEQSMTPFDRWWFRTIAPGRSWSGIYLRFLTKTMKSWEERLRNLEHQLQVIDEQWQKTYGSLFRLELTSAGQKQITASTQGSWKALTNFPILKGHRETAKTVKQHRMVLENLENFDTAYHLLQLLQTRAFTARTAVENARKALEREQFEMIRSWQDDPRSMQSTLGSLRNCISATHNPLRMQETRRKELEARRILENSAEDFLVDF